MLEIDKDIYWVFNHYSHTLTSHPRGLSSWSAQSSRARMSAVFLHVGIWKVLPRLARSCLPQDTPLLSTMSLLFPQRWGWTEKHKYWLLFELRDLSQSPPYSVRHSFLPVWGKVYPLLCTPSTLFLMIVFGTQKPRSCASNLIFFWCYTLLLT
jgi:hypothetical protein